MRNRTLLPGLVFCSMLTAGAILAAEPSRLGRSLALPRSKGTGLALPGRVAIDQGWTLQKPDLSRAVIYLDSHPELDAAAAPQAPRPAIAQQNKTFVPDLLVVPRGTVVEFPNRDPYSHNVFSRSPTASFDLDRYAAGQSKSYTFNETGVVQLFCNIHPTMKATVLVVPNRFFARADAAGRFEFIGVPPGEYDLVAWHERGEEQRQQIKVKAGEAAEISIALRESRRLLPAAERRRRAAAGVERGLGVKRERLKLPVVQDSHPAPTPRPR